MFEESQELLNKAKHEYKKQIAIKDYSIIGQIAVEDGDNQKVKVYCKKGFERIAKVEDFDNLSIEYEYPKIKKAPLKKDEKIGVYKVFDKNDLIFEENLYIMEEVKSKSITDKLKNILKKW